MEVNKELNELIENKNVCLVGPAPYLMNRKLGSFINSFDIVCRVNELFPFSHEEHYGERTDIMFHALHPEYIDGEITNFMRGYDIFQALKLIVVTWMPNPSDMSRWGLTIEQVYDRHFSQFAPKKRYIISKEDHDNLLRRLHNQMNAGIASISILNNYNFNKLFITGFSFYHEYNLGVKDMDKLHYPGKLTEPIIRRHKIDGKWIFNPNGSHNQEIQKEYFINDILRKKEDKIMIDSYLQNILSIKYENIFQL